MLLTGTDQQHADRDIGEHADRREPPDQSERAAGHRLVEPVKKALPNPSHAALAWPEDDHEARTSSQVDVGFLVETKRSAETNRSVDDRFVSAER
jgi:hypothetical protein